MGQLIRSASAPPPARPRCRWTRTARATTYICFDLPGIRAESIDLTVLTVRAERTPSQPEDAELIVSERPYGIFTRQVFLGETLDAENVGADYTSGVLTLTIPVREAAKPRSIQVTSRDDKQAVSA